jgi:hypothetical protein
MKRFTKRLTKSEIKNFIKSLIIEANEEIAEDRFRRAFLKPLRVLRRKYPLFNAGTEDELYYKFFPNIGEFVENNKLIIR